MIIIIAIAIAFAIVIIIVIVIIIIIIIIIIVVVIININIIILLVERFLITQKQSQCANVTECCTLAKTIQSSDRKLWNSLQIESCGKRKMPAMGRWCSVTEFYTDGAATAKLYGSYSLLFA